MDTYRIHSVELPVCKFKCGTWAKGGFPKMHCSPAREDSAVETALDKWRHKATNALTAATAVMNLPAIVLMVTEKGSPFTWPVQVVVLGAYAVTVFCAVLHFVDYRLRAWAFMAAWYAMAVVTNMANPEGPFTRAFPVVLPILMMVLFGVRAGRAGAVAGISVLLFAPFLSTVPGLMRMLVMEPAPAAMPLQLIWRQGVALTALLLTIIFLLDRFHHFLMQSLANIERESGERSAAYRKLEHEMRERRRLEHEVALAGDEERRRLGLEIHDGVCQQLTGALLRCEALARQLGRGQTLAAEELSALSSLLEESIDEAHAVAQGLYSLGPEPGALRTALAMLVKRTKAAVGIPCELTTTGDVSVGDPAAARHLYRIAQEALSNAARHAHANRITVELHGGKDGLFLQIQDDGGGLPDGISPPGMGLRTMAYRAHLLEGQFNVTPMPAGGTRVSCRVPHAGLARQDEPLNITGEENHGQ